MNKKPIFLHGLWRCGGTYVWNKFRQNSDYICFYEPLHEDLLHSIETEAKNNTAMRHGNIDVFYTHEYTTIEGWEEFYSPEFTTLENPRKFARKSNEVKEYIKQLINNEDKIPVLKFCRSVPHLKWFKDNFEGEHIYIKRPAHEMIISYLSYVYNGDKSSNYFIQKCLDIAIQNTNNSSFKPIKHIIRKKYKSFEDVVRILYSVFDYGHALAINNNMRILSTDNLTEENFELFKNEFGIVLDDLKENNNLLNNIHDKHQLYLDKFRN
jgi:hypothetical protein